MRQHPGASLGHNNSVAVRPMAPPLDAEQGKRIGLNDNVQETVT